MIIIRAVYMKWGGYLMEIRHLIYFTEVAHRRSFSAAAESLFLTQPTISKMIRNLEEELGIKSFDFPSLPGKAGWARRCLW